MAVLEVKAAIDSHADLTRALDNIASVKALDRSNRGRNKLLSDLDVHRLAAYYGYLEPTPDDPQRYVAGAEAMRAERLFVSEPDLKNEAPLVFFGYQLIDWFRIVPTIDIGPKLAF